MAGRQQTAPPQQHCSKDNICKDNQTKWAVTNQYAKEGDICLTVTLARTIRVATISLIYRDNQESRETKVITLIHVQTPDLKMPGNQITIQQDKRPHEFVIPKPFVGQVIQLAFDKKRVAWNGELPKETIGPFAGGRPSVFQRSPSLLVRWGDAWGCGGERAAAWASSGRGQLQQACGFTAV